ncbi:MAG: hypothetical protein EA359_02520 [Balneolaceae bacterium]|nr:MAG: hypothetical protein EA359_02520 [Balneolaceae bacterium]
MKIKITFICRFILTSILILCFCGLQSTNAATLEPFFFETSMVSQDTTKTSNKTANLDNRIAITQIGSGNSASVSQSGRPDSESMSTIRMSGNQNLAEIKSGGQLAVTEIVMEGTENRLTIHPSLYMNMFSFKLFDDQKVKKTNEFYLIFRNIKRVITIHQTDNDNLIITEEE